jgi:hypothetical protein
MFHGNDEPASSPAKPADERPARRERGPQPVVLLPARRMWLPRQTKLDPVQA